VRLPNRSRPRWFETESMLCLWSDDSLLSSGLYMIAGQVQIDASPAASTPVAGAKLVTS
jgi:hypothetical protein